jgi:hypothetical protein
MELLLQILQVAAATASAAAQARKVFNDAKAAAQQSGELTDAESVELDRRANEIFASAAQQSSGR